MIYNCQLTFLITCFNSERYISKMLNSLINQTNRKFNVLICDDGSTDSTFHILESFKKRFKDSGIKYECYKKENGGVSSAINYLLPMIKTNYFVTADSDDWYDDNFVEEFYLLLKEIGEFNVAVSDARFYKNDKIEIHQAIFEGDVFENYLFGKNIPCYSGVHIYNFSTFKNFYKDLKIYDSRAGQNFQLILPFVTTSYPCKIHSYYNVSCRTDSISHSSRQFEVVEKRNNGLIDILENVLLLISKWNEYKDLIYEKYYSLNLNSAFQHRNKSKFNFYYNKIKKRSTKIKIKKFIINSKLLTRMFLRE